MKIKSLLIGSAAAIVAAPAAFAADVIIAEPEPVEYVEVCDVAGAGYFYIPGSRTCLQISGLVRHELQFGENDSPVDGGEFNGERDGIDSLVRGELNIRTFTETELGDLTSFIRFRANDENNDALSVVLNEETGELDTQGAALNGSVFLNNATIGLGGLLMGLSDTLYDGGIAGEFDSFGGDRVHFIRYTADLGAFSAALSLEAERSFDSRFDYVPNVVGQISGDIGALSVDLWAAYDDEDEIEVAATGLLLEDDEFVTGDDEFSLKARVGFDFGPAALQVAGTYNSGENYYDNGYEWSVGASATVGLGEKASLTFGGQYFADGLDTVATTLDVAEGEFVTVDVDGNDDAEEWRIGANVDYEIVDGFDVKVAVNYRNIDDGIDGTDDVDGFDGFIRFDRSF